MTYKKCSKCGVDLIQGHNWTDGMVRSRSKICQECNSAKGKAWSKENRERAREVAKKRRHANPEKMREYRADYYARNKKKWAEYSRNWRASRRFDPVHRSKLILTFIQTRAKRKNLEFDLTLDFLSEKIIAGKCEVTGLDFVLEDYSSGKVHPFCPSIDRINPNRGYTKDNVRVVIYIYNIAKSEFSDSDVLKMAMALVARGTE